MRYKANDVVKLKEFRDGDEYGDGYIIVASMTSYSRSRLSIYMR
jgi:hypothetical protein